MQINLHINCENIYEVHTVDSTQKVSIELKIHD